MDAVADRRPLAVKPWRGPLPNCRVSPRLMLGDIPVSIHKPKFARKSLSPGEPSVEKGSSTARKKVAEESQDGERPVSRVGETVQVVGPNLWVGSASAAAHKRFGSECRIKFAEELGWLFLNGGKPSSLAIQSAATNKGAPIPGVISAQRKSRGAVEAMFSGYGGNYCCGRRGGRAFAPGRHWEPGDGGGYTPEAEVEQSMGNGWRV